MSKIIERRAIQFGDFTIVIPTGAKVVQYESCTAASKWSKVKQKKVAPKKRTA